MLVLDFGLVRLLSCYRACNLDFCSCLFDPFGKVGYMRMTVSERMVVDRVALFADKNLYIPCCNAFSTYFQHF